MNLIMRRMIGRAQKTLGRSSFAARMAVKLKNQCEMVIGARLGGSHIMALDGEQWLARLVAPYSRYFVDVGANVGEWTLMFAGHMAQAPAGLAFEPNPGTAKNLRLALQAVNLEGCEIVEAAAGDKTGSAPFFAEVNDGETSGFYSSRSRMAAAAVDVKLCRLDDELARRQVAEVDVLKIDVEGHDFFVMLGAQSYLAARRIRLIQFEYNAAWIDAGATLTRAFDYLGSHGYKVRLLRDGGIYELDVRKTGEFFKYSNFVAYQPGSFAGLLDRLPCPPAL